MEKFSTGEEQKAFELGVAHTKAYIRFCIVNYVYKLNLGGCMHFLSDLSDFLRGVNYIPNTQKNISFQKFCEEYPVEE